MIGFVRDFLDDLGWIGVAVAALVAAAAIVAGVAIWQEATEPTAGTVTGKDYRDQYWTQHCTTSQGTTHCTQQYHPACYEVRYTAGGETGDDCTAPEQWEAIEIGDWYEQ